MPMCRIAQFHHACGMACGIYGRLNGELCKISHVFHVRGAWDNSGRLRAEWSWVRFVRERKWIESCICRNSARFVFTWFCAILYCYTKVYNIISKRYDQIAHYADARCFHAYVHINRRLEQCSLCYVVPAHKRIVAQIEYEIRNT